MPKLAANLTMLFNEHAFIDRFGAAAQAGFGAVECQFPYAIEVERMAERLRQHQLQLVLHNLPAGRWEAGERGIACHPDRIGEFQDGVATAIDYATVLGAKQLNCLAGLVPEGVSRGVAHETLINNLRFAAGKLKSAGIRLLIEPINTFDVPGFFLSGTRQAVELIEQTGSDNLFIQYDIYHMQRMEGELANTIERHLPLIKHMQLADNPGRCEPGTGEINYRFLFGFLDRIGYDGWIGCEYKPKDGTADGLSWRAAHGV
jgi:hydroxypyruvate isomerase